MRSLIHTLYNFKFFRKLPGVWIRDDISVYVGGGRKKRRFASINIDLKITWGKPPLLPSPSITPKYSVILNSSFLANS